MTVIEKFLYDHDIVRQAKDGSLFPKYRECILSNTDLEILDTYNTQTRGICNYYSLACNFSKLSYFKYRIGKIWVISYKTKSGQQRMKIVKLSNLKRQGVFAYDTPDDLHPLEHAVMLFREAGYGNRNLLRCYVLISYPGDSFDYTTKWLETVKALGFCPMAMLYRDFKGDTTRELCKFQRSWARPAAIYSPHWHNPLLPKILQHLCKHMHSF